MAAIDKSFKVLGSETVVTVLNLYPQQDGSVVMVVAGGTKDAAGEVVSLGEARGRVQPTDPAIAPLMALALTALRHRNGLDDLAASPLAPLDPIPLNTVPVVAPPTPVVIIPDAPPVT